ncbi:MAG: hypothetical protein IPM48_06400 [Saprospiraceae bacterium]|nr:hypothetical protein [Saprospiraceae bacterium]
MESIVWSDVMRWLIISLVISFGKSAFSQELFPLAESANTLPKNVFALRLFTNGNYEIKTPKAMVGLRIMYGLGSKLSVYLSGTFSNHHSRYLPPDLVSHGHPSGGSPFYFTNRVAKGQTHPMNWNGIHVMAKYRLLSIDRRNKHYRIALISEWSNVRQAHDEAEPNLLHDNKGWSGGMIHSFLYHRLAVSSTLQLVLPGDYREVRKDPVQSVDVERTMKYGNSINWSISFGYLLNGNTKNDFDEPNINLYIEFMGAAWQSAQFIYNGQIIPNFNPAFHSGYYMEIHPGIQRVIRSNWRLELSLGLPLIHQSLVHSYPIYSFAVQRFFY